MSFSFFSFSFLFQVTQSAWFCLQPYGDGPSRHVTMDCMAADTVPVFFDKCASQLYTLIVNWGIVWSKYCAG